MKRPEDLVDGRVNAQVTRQNQVQQFFVRHGLLAAAARVPTLASHQAKLTLILWRLPGWLGGLCALSCRRYQRSLAIIPGGPR